MPSPGEHHVALHHGLRQQLLGLDPDSVLENLAAVVATKQLVRILLPIWYVLVAGLARLVVLDARGGRQLQPSEEDLMVVGRVRVTGAQLAGTLAREARQVDQLEHRPCCGIQWVNALPFLFQELAVDKGRRHAPQLILIKGDERRKRGVAFLVLHTD